MSASVGSSDPSALISSQHHQAPLNPQPCTHQPLSFNNQSGFSPTPALTDDDADEIDLLSSARPTGSSELPGTDDQGADRHRPRRRSSARIHRSPGLSGSVPAEASAGGSTSPRPAKRRKRASRAHALDPADYKQATEFSGVAMPRYTVDNRSGTKEDPHIIILKAGVTDGVLSTHHDLAPGTAYKNNGFLHEPPPELLLTWEYMIGIRLARLLRLRKDSNCLALPQCLFGSRRPADRLAIAPPLQPAPARTKTGTSSRPCPTATPCASTSRSSLTAACAPTRTCSARP